jgi:hypothetical protein
MFQYRLVKENHYLSIPATTHLLMSFLDRENFVMLPSRLLFLPKVSAGLILIRL